ncbi:MAG: DUF4105 domain-containing protein [Gemmatimonadota bacterium]
MTPLPARAAIRRVRALWLVCLAVLSSASRAAAQTAAPQPENSLQIFLMTMGPGAEVWERFGHNAIWVRDSAAGRDLVYNYGTFDFRDPNLVPHFAMGRPIYWLGVGDLEGTLREYAARERSVEVQELNLSPRERAEIALRLAQNATPEQRNYRYDYYRDNCSTRVRDLLDGILGGALRRATEGQPAEGTLRWHTHRSLTNDKLLYVGILAALGPAVDQPLDQWGEMFLPRKLQERVRELSVVGPDGRTVPLVKREARLVDIDRYRVEPEPPNWGPLFSLVAIAVTLLLLSGLIAGPLGVPGQIAGALWLLTVGIGGLVLLFLWIVSNHTAAARNHNLLLLSPVALLVIPGVLSARRRGPGAWAPRAAWFVIGSVIIGSLLAALPSIGGQWNLQIAQLTALPSLAAAWLSIRLSPRRDPAPPSPR